MSRAKPSVALVAGLFMLAVAAGCSSTPAPATTPATTPGGTSGGTPSTTVHNMGSMQPGQTMAPAR